MDSEERWEPFWWSEFLKRSRGDLIGKDWARAGTYLLLFSPQNDFLTLDLANYGPDGTQDHLNPVRRTLLYRHFARRAHHLPPDPNILNAKTFFVFFYDHFQILKRAQGPPLGPAPWALAL